MNKRMLLGLCILTIASAKLFALYPMWDAFVIYFVLVAGGILWGSGRQAQMGDSWK